MSTADPSHKYAAGASEVRMRALLNRFEGRPEVDPEPQPRRERVVSALDEPRAVVDGAAAVERDLAKMRLDALSPSQQTPKSAFATPAVIRNVPAIAPCDSDKIIALKREIIAKETEIQSVAGKIMEVVGKLDRIVGMLQVADMPVVQDDGDHHAHVPIFGKGTLGAGSEDGSSDKSMSVEEPRSRSKSVPPASSTPASVTGNTLAEILAAARGGGGNSTRVKSEKPKYAAFLKELQ